MNFFDDDFGLSSSPVYPNKKGPTSSYMKPGLASDQQSRKSGKSVVKDQFDDLLDNLMQKEKKKQVKNKQRQAVQPYSSTQLEFNNPAQDFRRTEKWSTPNIQFNLHNESPKFTKGRINSLEDRGSEDGRSYKSGATGRQAQQIEFDNLMTLRGPEIKQKDEPVFVPERSARNMMRPPLAKNMSRDQINRQPKQTSIINEDVSQKFSRGFPESTANIQLLPDRPRSRESRSFIPESKSVAPEAKTVIPEFRSVSPQIKERIIQREKVVTVRQEATELKKLFELEVKEIKESYQRQLKATRQQWQQEILESKASKQKLIKQFEQRLEEEKKRWQTLQVQSTARMKEMHEWQLRKKEEAHDLQVQKIKSMHKMEDSIGKQLNNQQAAQQALQLKAKQTEVQNQAKRLEEVKKQLDQRQQNLEFEEQNFQVYLNREQSSLQTQKKQLLEQESSIKKIELEKKRSIQMEKQQVAQELATAELDLIKKKEAILLEKQEITAQRDLLAQEKGQLEALSKTIMESHKERASELDKEKEKMYQLEIELHKKIHIVDLKQNQQLDTSYKERLRPSSTNQENRRNRANSQLNWAQQTKERYHEMENMARKSAIETQEERDKIKEKTNVNLSGYIQRLNRAISRH